ncbi:hypothetical protein EJB05_22443 [Eragrostis curvula]|uniref:Uncharacterized protein n=1 Tax=Eragrostis curvula TaxID=38414 RepID=A0A5J9V689_9POAL|nr:hypothetical protein EJB05_22443 [Eragrostis curvula]
MDNGETLGMWEDLLIHVAQYADKALSKVRLILFNRKCGDIKKVVPECVFLMKPGSSPGKTTTPPQLAGEVVRRTCSGLKGCRGGPAIFQGRALGVHTGYDSQIGRAISVEGVNAAMKAWLQIPPDVIKTTGEMIQSLPI